jgi:hypothetical protein
MSSRVCPASGISSPSCADPPTSPTSGSIAAQANAACSAAAVTDWLKYILDLGDTARQAGAAAMPITTAPRRSDDLAVLRQTHLFGSLAAITSRRSMDGGWVNSSPACASTSALAAR